MRALELWEKRAFVGEHNHMKTISVRIANQNITSIRDVNAIGEIGYSFAADSSAKFTIFVIHNDTMTLRRFQKHLQLLD